MPDSELAATLQLLMHPRSRQPESVEEALAKLTPQTSRRSANQARTEKEPLSARKAKQSGRQTSKNSLKRTRQELSAEWREELQAAGSAAKRLARLPPATKGSKKHKPSLYVKAQKKRLQRKLHPKMVHALKRYRRSCRKMAARRLVLQMAEPTAAKETEAGPLAGKQVCLPGSFLSSCCCCCCC